MLQRRQQFRRFAVDLPGEKRPHERLSGQPVTGTARRVENIPFRAHSTDHRQEVIGATDVATPAVLDAQALQCRMAFAQHLRQCRIGAMVRDIGRLRTVGVTQLLDGQHQGAVRRQAVALHGVVRCDDPLPSLPPQVSQLFRR
ncbi:hypothetical protein D9M68_764180 [compost metagenome]